jgi:hypothetical protein
MTESAGLLAAFSRDFFSTPLKHASAGHSGEFETPDTMMSRVELGKVADQISASIDRLEFAVRSEMNV